MRASSGLARRSLLSPSSNLVRTHRRGPAERFQLGAACGAGLLAAAGLAGWLLHVRVLTSIAADTQPIKANTAVALLCASASVACLRADAGTRARRAGRLLGLLVCLFGVLVCFEYLVGPLGFDQLLFHDPRPIYPGRPSLPTAVALVALGTALVTLDARRLPAWIAQSLLIASSAVVVFAVVGYLYDVPIMRGFDGRIGISPQCLTALALLTLGAFALRPDRGLTSLLRGGDPGARIARILVPAAFIASIGTGGLALLLVSRHQLDAHEAQAAVAVVRAAAISAIVLVLAARLRRSDLRDHELARTEQALREVNARLHAMVDNAPVGISLRDLDGRVLKVNDFIAATMGMSARELESKAAHQLLSAEQMEQMRVELEEILRTGRPVASESETVTPDGGSRSFEVLRYPVLDEWGEIGSIGTFVLDVTERKQAAAALAAADRRFRSAFDNAPIGMVILGIDGLVVEVNAAFCEILGRDRADLVGRRADSFVHPDDVDLGRARTRALLDDGRTSYGDEVRFLHAAGRTIHVALQTTVLRGPDGEPLHVLGQVQDITERKRHEQQLEFLADHDALTGLLNRRAFKRELEAHAQLVERYGAVGAVLVIDLDQFKFVNDTLGHQAGDELISRAAKLFSDRVRSADVIARLGGDEFGILLRHAGRDEARLVADSLLAALREEAISIGGLDRRISASIGIAMFADGGSADSGDVLVNADLAMYDAKEDGRDGIALFSTSERNQSRMKGRITWAHRIQSALAEDRFTLLAQPIVDLATGRVSQYELLLRMVDERGELIVPTDFLPIAERVDLILQVDTWVISNAIRMLAELDPVQDDAPGPAVEINLSGRSLGNPGLLAHIERELEATGVDPGRIIFEITETAALGSISEARAFGERLSELGCRFALDDFGAGFASFYYLKHLHFDVIKIDGEFVRNCCCSDIDQLLIKAIVEIARGLGTRTVAEFVGDDETVELIASLGVDYGQGYHLGAPAPLAEHLARRRLNGHGDARDDQDPPVVADAPRLVHSR